MQTWVAAVLVLAAVAASVACQTPPLLDPGRAVLRVAVFDDGRPTSARLRVVGADGMTHVSPDAIELIGDCEARSVSQTPDAVARGASREFRHRATEATEFYAAGSASVSLTPGTYSVSVFKGLEFRSLVREVTLEAGEFRELRMDLSRWMHAAAEGWYSADGHMHVPRPDSSRDADLTAWLQAEDLNVDALLQWGNAAAFASDVQHAFGERGTVVGADSLLLPGQEYPRTKVFGHSSFLGGDKRVQVTHYLDYRSAYLAARRAHALTGIMHNGEWGGDVAAAVLLAENLVDFIEVFAFRTPNYDVWYQVLNTGLRIAPTAGTDAPCGAGGVPPGTPRFYARVEGPLTRKSFMDAVREARTFVTNGPLLRVTVEGREMGDELVLDHPSRVRMRATVRYDPERTRVDRVEFIHNDYLIGTFGPSDEPGRIAVEMGLPIEEASWLAIRTYGNRLDALAVRDSSVWRHGYSHSSPVWVRVAGEPSLSETPRARDSIDNWLDLLDAREADLRDPDRLRELAAARESDGISVDALARSRFVAIHQIQRARAAWRWRLAGVAPLDPSAAP